ncbi:MAG TPA: hypothetical protein DDY38_07785 [Firmicutes bacterium]|nr:hypothetical protein [Bacillota bacterium]
MSMVAVRLAGEGDRAAIAEISKHYDSNLIHLVYNTWQQQGSLYIAEVEGKVIGFCCLTFPAPTEAQILGIRLLPEYQKEQTGRDFIISLMQIAQEKGCNVVRMLTSSENYETQAALQRNLNFERSGTWVIGCGEELNSVPCSGPALESASPALLEDIWQFLQYSQTYRRSQGLIYTDLYAFRSFSKAHLSQQLAAGKVFAWLEGDTVAGVALADLAKDTISLNYLDAKPHAVKDLLAGIICNRKCKHLTSAMPLDSYWEAKPFLEKIIAQHRPDQWLVMVKEVSPLASTRD